MRSWAREDAFDPRPSVERRAEQNRRAAEASGAAAARALAETNERLVSRLAKVSEAALIRQLEVLAAGGFEPRDIAGLSQAAWRAIQHLELLQGRATSRIDVGHELDYMRNGVAVAMREILALVAERTGEEFAEELTNLLADKLHALAAQRWAGEIEQEPLEETELAEIEPAEGETP